MYDMLNTIIEIYHRESLLLYYMYVLSDIRFITDVIIRCLNVVLCVSRKTTNSCIIWTVVEKRLIFFLTREINFPHFLGAVSSHIIIVLRLCIIYVYISL